MDESDEVLKLSRQLLDGAADWPRCENDPIPEYLKADYARILAATKIGDFGTTRISEAALVCAALQRNADDRMRIMAVQQLLATRSEHAEVVLLGLLLDEDPELRLTAIEGLVLLGGSCMPLAAHVLKNDTSQEVRLTIGRAASGQEIPLYHLDPIEPQSQYDRNESVE